MTLQEQIKEFEDRWFVTTKYVSEEEVKSWQLKRDVNSYFLIEGDELPILFADFKPKRIVYSNYRIFYQKEFFDEFKLLAKRVREEMDNDNRTK